MNIGIIGTGNIGGTLTRRLTKIGHRVFIANSRGVETLRDLADETTATPGTVYDVVENAELVVVTIPMKNVPNLPKDLFTNAPEDLVVIDTCNYYPQQRDGKIEEIENGMPESRWVEKQLGRPVIKVFNNIWFKHLLEAGLPAGTSGRIALPVSGDSETAKQKVMALVDELGFDAVDVGSLDESWRHQPGTPCYTNDLDAPRLREALQAASPVRTDNWKA